MRFSRIFFLLYFLFPLPLFADSTAFAQLDWSAATFSGPVSPQNFGLGAGEGVSEGVFVTLNQSSIVNFWGANPPSWPPPNAHDWPGRFRDSLGRKLHSRRLPAPQPARQSPVSRDSATS